MVLRKVTGFVMGGLLAVANLCRFAAMASYCQNVALLTKNAVKGMIITNEENFTLLVHLHY